MSTISNPWTHRDRCHGLSDQTAIGLRLKFGQIAVAIAAALAAAIAPDCDQNFIKLWSPTPRPLAFAIWPLFDQNMIAVQPNSDSDWIVIEFWCDCDYDHDRNSIVVWSVKRRWRLQRVQWLAIVLIRATTRETIILYIPHDRTAEINHARTRIDQSHRVTRLIYILC